MNKPLNVLVIDDSLRRAGDICAALALAGHRVAAVLPSSLNLSAEVQALSPDVILIQTETPSRDTLEHLSIMGRDMPRPVVVFAQDDDDSVIRQAVQAGVSAYVVDGLDAGRLKSVIQVALAHFEQFQAVKKELAETSRKLTERKTIEKAKGILMKARGLSEEDAYSALRRLAMERGRTLSAVSRDVIAMAGLLL
ncbi:MAG: ANTAR domain-containing protein [Rhodocyclaceae bacterium]|nr:ANTAR domain-containing protein [Rhodocyclaceae bacterium]